MEFIDCYCGWPGSAHDSRVWRNSPIYQKLRTSLPHDFHVLGDSAYPLQNFIMVPFKDNGHLTRSQKTFNKRLSQTRVTIEQAYGRLKGIWRRLRYLNITNLCYFKYIVICCCILHNLCLRENVEYMQEEEEQLDEQDIENNYLPEPAPAAAVFKRNAIMAGFMNHY